MKLVYKNEKPLFILLLIVSLLIWVGLAVLTKGVVLFYVFIFSLFYLFAQSAFISYLRGTAAEITSAQFPDIYEKIIDCSKKLDLPNVPDAYRLVAKPQLQSPIIIE